MLRALDSAVFLFTTRSCRLRAVRDATVGAVWAGGQVFASLREMQEVINGAVLKNMVNHGELMGFSGI